MPNAEKDAPARPREQRALAEAGRVNFTEPPAHLSVVCILGRDVRIEYSPNLTTLGVQGTYAYDYTWMPLVIRLREWNERVFLHEVLHLLVEYPHLFDMISEPDPLRPISERAVQVIEDGLWDMGWRWHASDTPPEVTADPEDG